MTKRKKILMGKKKKKEDWNLHSLEKAIEDNTLDELLIYILNHDGEKTAMDALKASGYFISPGTNRDMRICNNQVLHNKIRNNFVNLLSKNQKVIFNKYCREASILRKRRNQIQKYSISMLSQYDIECEELIEAAVKWMTRIDLEAAKLCGISNPCDGAIEQTVSSLSTLILKSRETSNTEQKRKGNYELANILLHEEIYLQEFIELIKSWVYGEVDVKKRFGKVNIKMMSGRNRDCLLSLNHFLCKKRSIEYQTIINEGELKGVYYSLQTYKALNTANTDYMLYVYDQTKKIRGIEIERWYDVFEFFNRTAQQNHQEFYVILSKSDIVTGLKNSNFNEDNIKDILDTFIFSSKNKDLFESFLIPKSTCDDFYFIPNLFLRIENIQSFLNRVKWINDGAEVRDKGTLFEDHIRKMAEIKCKTENVKKVKTPDGQYSADLVIRLGDALFFCECKTQNQISDIKSYYESGRELAYYLRKFKRNYTYFTECDSGVEIIKDKFKMDSFKAVAVFISNVEYPEEKIDDIYITDDIRIEHFLNRIPTRMDIWSLGGKCPFDLFPDLYREDISAEQLLLFLKSKKEEVKFESRMIKKIKSRIPLYRVNMLIYAIMPFDKRDYLETYKENSIFHEHYADKLKNVFLEDESID